MESARESAAIKTTDSPLDSPELAKIYTA